ncbi:hypothetical protein L1887_14693 [Cichorium endivia]|nr:hypothetical protein L1887_14693 [Cichorium endivia]
MYKKCMMDKNHVGVNLLGFVCASRLCTVYATRNYIFYSIDLVAIQYVFICIKKSFLVGVLIESEFYPLDYLGFGHITEERGYIFKIGVQWLRFE